MIAHSQRAGEALEPLELTTLDAFSDQPLPSEQSMDYVPEPEPPIAEPGAGGRQVLGWGLSLLALLWIGFVGWSAGAALGAQPVSAPMVAQWFAIAAGPLALLGLGWLLFGRSRRRETERFTRSVQMMQTEARSLET